MCITSEDEKTIYLLNHSTCEEGIIPTIIYSLLGVQCIVRSNIFLILQMEKIYQNLNTLLINDLPRTKDTD